MEIYTEYWELGSKCLHLVQDSFRTQHVIETTRDENVLDIVLSSQKERVDNVNICEPNFHKARYKDLRKYLAKKDWNNTLENKTATECWNIIKSEIDCIVKIFVPLKKQGKQSKKKHLSKEAIRNIKYKQIMWKMHRHTGSEEDNAIHK